MTSRARQEDSRYAQEICWFMIPGKNNCLVRGFGVQISLQN